MAEAPRLVTNADGMIVDGLYKGRHINEVLDYLNHLEEAAQNEPAKPEAAAPAKPATPAENLAARSSERISGFEQLTQATAARAIQDDEDDFVAGIKDYDAKAPGSTLTIRQTIAELKKKTPLAQQMTRGWHRQAYMFIKQQDPAVQRRILGEADPEPEDEPSVEPEAEPAAVVAAPPVAAAPKPKPVPAVRPTPAGRAAAKPAEKASTLKDPDGKLARVAAAMGKSLAAYLLSLEERGVTQDQINTQSVARAGQPRRKSVYDNV